LIQIKALIDSTFKSEPTRVAALTPPE